MPTSDQRPKFPAAPAAVVAMAAALLLVSKPRQSAFVAPPNPYVFDLVATCDMPTDPGITGIIWSAGNASGQYSIQVLTPPTNTFTFTGVDSRLPWFVTAQTYQTNQMYDILYQTNDDGSTTPYATNFSNIGPASPERFTIGKDAMPTMRVIQGLPVLMLYGVTNHSYTFVSGQDFTDTNSMTNVFGPIHGTNGLEMVAHFGAEPSWYFKTLVQ